MPQVALTHHAIERWEQRVKPNFSEEEVAKYLKKARQLEWSEVQRITKKPDPNFLYWRYRDVVMVVKYDGDDWYVLVTFWKLNKNGKFKQVKQRT